MARRPIPTPELKLHGKFRADRHGERADVSPPSGAPVRPVDMDETESSLWDQVVPDLVRRGLVGESDTAELRRMVELWSLYRKALALAKQDPVDKEIRCAVTGYGLAFGKIAGKFGLTTQDRASLKLPKADGSKP